MIIEGLQYGFGESYWSTKPRGVRNDFFAFSINSINIVSEASDQQLQIMDIQFKAFKGTVVNHANLLIGDN